MTVRVSVITSTIVGASMILIASLRETVLTNMIVTLTTRYKIYLLITPFLFDSLPYVFSISDVNVISNKLQLYIVMTIDTFDASLGTRCTSTVNTRRRSFKVNRCNYEIRSAPVKRQIRVEITFKLVEGCRSFTMTLKFP